MRRGREAAESTWVSVCIDLLTLAARARANQIDAPQRTLRQDCLRDSGPRIAYDGSQAGANDATANASACTLAAPRAFDA
jgi:hypothetical protein